MVLLSLPPYTKSVLTASMMYPTSLLHLISSYNTPLQDEDTYSTTSFAMSDLFSLNNLLASTLSESADTNTEPLTIDWANLLAYKIPSVVWSNCEPVAADGNKK